ncbi:right-handed parallel beta-helix repeat-containing protein [uncultured Methanobrevibacter sp.]|uniref:right-handed parallel beta-helix repeat-containing protein n=1 Tax=uncultured Methanobrevibacter sp. TaxID=253161 RepID=UPI0025F4D891|nr:right-handed parallel beta-helix repeat-containing protein [uncultured Methanobrevibacter sp.]
MSRKNLIIISIFLLFILSVGMVSASDDVSFDSAQEDASIDSNLLGDAGIMENIVSEGENDDGDDADLDSNANSEIPVDEKTFDAIQNAIAHASENDTILLNGTYTATEKNMVIVNRAVTIQGVDNAILDGNGFKVRFRINCPNVIFKGICFKNFSLEDNETGVIVTKNGVAVSNCSFINNTAIFSAIYATGGISNITNCSFSSNSNNIGTIFLNKTSAEISNCRFDGNKIIYENDDYELVDGEMPYGLIASLKSKVILSNSDFYNNKMCGISAVLSNCSVTNCNFNKTESPVYLYNSNSTVKNSLFTALKSGITVCGGNNTIDACRFIKNTGTSILIDGELAYECKHLFNMQFKFHRQYK